MPSAKAQTFDSPSFKMAISPGARKALTDYWGNDDILSQPEIIADIGADGVSRINRIGRKSLLQIAQALDTLGYIDSSHQWLTKEKTRP